MNKLDIKTSELYELDIPFLKELFNDATYPWEILPRIKEFIKNTLSSGLPGFKLYKDNILLGENVAIATTATIIGPAIICDNVTIRPGAFIRENVIVGPESVVGNSSELKNCILLRHVQAPHYNYVGDSILGNYSHLGAGSICSNLKSDGKNVVIHAEEDHETTLRKVGSFVADHADVGSGCVLNPGTIIGKNTRVYPLVLTRGVYPKNCIIKGTYLLDSIKENK